MDFFSLTFIMNIPISVYGCPSHSLFKWAKFNRFSARVLVPLLGVCLCLICNKLFYR